MGIQGLLPLLKSIHKPTHLRNFAGQTLGVDAYGWLHRGTVSCAIELAQQKPTRKHIDFALSRVRMLIHFGVKPYLVFDGDYLPSKAHTEKERAAKRKESKRLGLELLAMDRPAQAYLELQKAIDVTPTMARELIEELKQLDVPYIVAPYEADSQLAYLEKQGIISGVLSEDSDLLVFGVKCLLTKLDQYGECVVVNRADFTACREISLAGWTDKEFRIMAMLNGCDYLPGIDKMGLKTAYRLVRKHKAVERVVRSVQFDGKMKVPAGYLEEFKKAENTFLYQWVFCPEARGLVNLNRVPAEIDISGMPYIGKEVEAKIAAAVAAGDLDPNTKERLVVSNKFPQRHAARTKPSQTPDLKQGKPISEFFKPRRTPLAELDPNSFTPSPSQQRLLQNQQGASWSASQIQNAQRVATTRARTAPTPSSAPTEATRRAVTDHWPDQQRKPPKRQRLCSDSMLADSMGGDVGLQTATSRFFSKQGTQPSPSLRKASRQKQKDDFELWSDDSVAEVVAEMTETPEPTVVTETPSPKKRKKWEVYADPQPDNAESADTSQESTVTAASSTLAQVDHVDTPASSVGSDILQSKRTVFSNGVDNRFAALKSKFIFQSSSPNNSISRTKSTPLATRDALSMAGRIEILGRLAGPTIPQINPTHKRSSILPTPAGPTKDNDATLGELDQPQARAAIAEEATEDEEVIGDEDWLAVEHQDASVNPKSMAFGSEDLLVPNSPESGDGDSKATPKLNLNRFAFGS